MPTPTTLSSLPLEFEIKESNNKPIFRGLMLASWIINLLLIGLAIFFYFRLPPEVPLFYSLALDEQQLAPRLFFFLLPALGLLINFLHTLVLNWFRHYDEFLLRLFAGLTLAWQILIFIITLRLIFLVT